MRPFKFAVFASVADFAEVVLVPDVGFPAGLARQK